ncbi:MAG: SixA phosphatase family protein [Steroidobacteraceae bacterium]
MTEINRNDHAELKRRPLLAPIWLGVIAAVAVLLGVLWGLSAPSVSTYYVIRHAEAEAGVEDPPLSRMGEARAQHLVTLFAGAEPGMGLDGILVTDLRRTQETARPLANRLGIPVVALPAGDVEATVKRAREDFAGGRVLIVGHSNTVPDLVKALSGTRPRAIGEGEHDRLYIVTRPRFGPASVAELSLD